MGLLYPQSTEDSFFELEKKRPAGIAEVTSQERQEMSALIRSLENCLLYIQQAISESEPSVLLTSAISNRITATLGARKER